MELQLPFYRRHPDCRAEYSFNLTTKPQGRLRNALYEILGRGICGETTVTDTTTKTSYIGGSRGKHLDDPVKIAAAHSLAPFRIAQKLTSRCFGCPGFAPFVVQEDEDLGSEVPPVDGVAVQVKFPLRHSDGQDASSERLRKA